MLVCTKKINFKIGTNVIGLNEHPEFKSKVYLKKNTPSSKRILSFVGS